MQRGGRPHPAAVAEALAGSGDPSAAWTWLQRALEQRDDWLLSLLQSPAFDNLRGPRLRAALAEHGIAHLAEVEAARSLQDLGLQDLGLRDAATSARPGGAGDQGS